MVYGTQTLEEADMDLRERLSLRLQARTLDRALANGASPDSSEQLARRAQALLRADTRNQIAASLRRLARDEDVRRDLERLSARLLEPGPVAPRGVALTQELLTDRVGALSSIENADELRARIRAALAALEPRISDPKPETEGKPR